MMNFPASPSMGQQYPPSALPGVPVYYWDGEKWGTTALIAAAQPSAAAPLMDGAVAVGTSLDWTRGDHVHPTDTAFVPLANPTFTGTLSAPSFTFSVTSR